MNPALFTPFIKSAENVFSTMLQLEVEVEEPRLMDPGRTPHEVSAIVELAGPCLGSVVLGFETHSAQRIVALFTGSEAPSDSPEFADAVGELASMIAGGAGAIFKDRHAFLSPPRVVLGSEPTRSASDEPVLVVPCVTDCGRFVVELSIVEQGEAALA